MAFTQGVAQTVHITTLYGANPVAPTNPAVTVSLDSGATFEAPDNAAITTAYGVRLELSAAETARDMVLVRVTADNADAQVVAFYFEDAYTAQRAENLDATVSSRAAAGAEMDLVDAPNSTAISAIQSGLATEANQTTILARLGAWTGTGVNTILGAFKALLSKAASNPSDIGGTFSASTDSTEAISESIGSLSTGSGAKSVAITVLDQNDDPVRCDVLIPGIASGVTNASTGVVTFMLDPGTYSVSLGPAGGYTFSNPYTLTVTTSASQTASLTATKTIISDPSGSNECVVYGYVYDQNNEPVENAIVKIRPYNIPSLTDADGIAIQSKLKTYLTNSSGYFSATLVRSSAFDPTMYYEIQCEAVGYRKIVEVPDETTSNWYDLDEAAV